MKKFLAAATIGSTLLLSAPAALAWDGVVSGKIETIEITHGGNLAFRIWLAGGVTMCSAGARFAYLNEADSNYKVIVAGLMMAKAQGNTVSVYSTNKDAAWCQIGHVTIGS